MSQGQWRKLDVVERVERGELTASLKIESGPSLDVENFAQIAKAHLDFGDLTVLVGPQATGKSIIPPR